MENRYISSIIPSTSYRVAIIIQYTADPKTMAQSSSLRNVYIVGAQCTGKTTLVNALQEHYGRSKGVETPHIIREVARNVLAKYQFTRDDITTSPSRALQLQEHILEAQCEAEQVALRASSSVWYISDRSGLDPIAYARVFVGEEASKQLLASTAWTDLEERMKDGVVILCEAGCSWLVDDGTRLMPDTLEDWMRVDRAFRDLLEEREIHYHTMSKDLTDLAERVAMVNRWTTNETR